MLNPAETSIASDGQVAYHAKLYRVGSKNPADVTKRTTFSIGPDGSCTGNICTATKAGDHTVTGSVDLGDGATATGTATLHVVAGPLASLTLRPDPATITAGKRMAYHADGFDAYGNPLGDQTAATRFSIGPDGSCTGNICTATKAGDHTVTGRSHEVTGTATLRVNGKDAIGGSAPPPPPTSPSPPPSVSPSPSPSPSGTVGTTAPPDCLPTARQTSGLRMAPGKGPPGTLVRITAKLNRTFAGCPLTLLLGGTVFGDTTAGRDGGVSDRRTVPEDAKPGRTTLALARADGRILGTTLFEVLAKPSPAALRLRIPLPVAAALLGLTGLAGATIAGERARRQRRWVGQHVHVQPSSRPGHITATWDPHAPPPLAVRVEPRGHTGTIATTKEEDR